jgi:hypothetical protein
MVSDFRKLWATESWFTRVEMVVYLTVGVSAVVYLTLDVLSGFVTGEWNLRAMLVDGLLYGLASTWFDYRMWRPRALEAEKPLPPNQVVITYPTVGSADIARMVEESARRERAASFVGRR